MRRIRDCSYYCEGVLLWERLCTIAAQLIREDALIEEQKQSYLRQGKGFTDPRNGITYFPRKEKP